MPLQVLLIPALKDNYIHLMHDDACGVTAVIDPSEAAPVLSVLQEYEWALDFILNTHHHWDHVGGNLELKKQTGCKILGFEGDAHRLPGLNEAVFDGQELTLGSARFSVLHIPGHTLGHVAYYSAQEKIVFTGDTLFSLGCGRLFEGTAGQMHRSLEQLAALPEDTAVYCGHEYTEANGRFAMMVEPKNVALAKRVEQVKALRSCGKPSLPSSIGVEKSANPFLRCGSMEIRETLGVVEATDSDVFAALRLRKDAF